MSYYELIKEYGANKGEKAMWIATEMVSDYIKPMKHTDPEGYWKLMKDTYAAMCGKHYNEKFAMWDVSKMHSTDKTGMKKEGAHWTVEQVETATAGMKFPVGTTKYDKFVAMNASYHDWNKLYDDAEILKIGYAFWFADEDWGDDTKIWEYMEHKPKK